MNAEGSATDEPLRFQQRMDRQWKDRHSRESRLPGLIRMVSVRKNQSFSPVVVDHVHANSSQSRQGTHIELIETEPRVLSVADPLRSSMSNGNGLLEESSRVTNPIPRSHHSSAQSTNGLESDRGMIAVQPDLEQAEVLAVPPVVAPGKQDSTLTQPNSVITQRGKSPDSTPRPAHRLNQAEVAQQSPFVRTGGFVPGSQDANRVTEQKEAPKLILPVPPQEVPKVENDSTAPNHLSGQGLETAAVVELNSSRHETESTSAAGLEDSPAASQGRPTANVSNPQKPVHVAAQWPLSLLDGGKIEVSEGEPTSDDEQTVSLNVTDADVRTVFEMLARGYKMNILVAPEVTGTITANVTGLTPHQTLHGILRMANLRAIEEGGLIFIHPSNSVPNEARQLRMFPLDFARAEVLEPTVQGLLSPVGNAYISTIDSADNLQSREAIVVVDLPQRILEIESFIYQADQPPRQVMVEARVLEVELKDELQHGVDLTGLLRGDLTVGSRGFTVPGLSGNLFDPRDATFFASVSGDRIGALIDLLEQTTDAKTLATPSVTVVNGQKASILVGNELGYPVTTVTLNATTQTIEFLRIGVSLEIQPTISRDGKVLMQVRPEVSSGDIDFTTQTPVPNKGTREVETSVLLNNHEGMVIGGLIEEKDRTTIKKLPWLGDVRYVGKLFQNRDIERVRTEIIVTLVPHIIEMGCQTQPDCIDCEGEAVRYQRTVTPLFHGDLKRTCRPWEPRLPDSVGDDRHLDVGTVNGCLP